jgi:predicted nucleic acid-binding protein
LASVPDAPSAPSPSLRASGRKPAVRPYDALIAATAIAHGLPLFGGAGSV